MVGSRDLPLEDLTVWELMEMLRLKSFTLQVWDQDNHPGQHPKLVYQHDGANGLGDKVWHHRAGKPVNRLYLWALLTAEDHKFPVVAFSGSAAYRPALGLEPKKKRKYSTTLKPLQLMDGDEEDAEIVSERPPPSRRARTSSSFALSWHEDENESSSDCCEPDTVAARPAADASTGGGLVPGEAPRSPSSPGGRSVATVASVASAIS